MMRRLFLVLGLWFGISASAFAVETTYYTTTAATSQGCSAFFSGQTNYGCYGPPNNLCAATDWNTCYNAPSRAAAYFVTVASCPSGTLDVSNKCVPACEYNAALPATDPACVAPSTCAEGQTWSGTACVSDVPNPGQGTDAPLTLIPIGMTDAAGNVTHNSNWDSIMAGTPLIYNCGGWECSVSASGYDEATSCTYPTGGGMAACGFYPVYTGNIAAVGGSTVPSSTGGTSNVSLPAVGCPAGYTLNSSGICVTGATAGTASTSTTPGTAATAGIGSCPTGYTLNASGVCEGQASTGVFGTQAPTCPAGYTIDALGHCSATATIGADGAISDVSEYGVPEEENLLIGTVNAGAITPVAVSSVAATCPADVVLPRGLVWSWGTVCNFATFLRPFVLALAWLSAGMMVLGGAKAEI